jgi:hypothetical protein
MIRKLATMVPLLVLSLTFTAPQAAGSGLVRVGGDSPLSCSEAEIDLWENVGWNGRGLAVCKNFNVPDLGTYSFDNITSAAALDVKNGVDTHVCVYDLKNYNHDNPLAWSEDYGPGDESHQYFFGGDKISSVKWVSC